MILMETTSRNNDRYRPHPDVTTRVAGSDLLLVQLTDGVAFRLNRTGAAIWELVTTGNTVAEIVDQLHARTGVASEQLSQETRSLLEELEQCRLLERQPERG
jgi:UDP-N-acetylglucosamine 2-epimerase